MKGGEEWKIWIEEKKIGEKKGWEKDEIVYEKVNYWRIRF